MGQINVSNFPKFGSINKGASLAGIFDGSGATVGWAEAATAFVGVDFRASPEKISSIEAVGWLNGFDGSGLTSPITLTIRARNGGSLPAINDGTVIAATSFTDINAAVTKTLISNDAATEWDYVWAVLNTGVWSQLAELRFFRPDVIVEPVAPASSPAIYQVACNDGFPLPWSPVVVPGFTFDIAVDEPSAALVDWSVNVSHVGNLFTPPYLGAIGIGSELVFKFSLTFAGLDAAAWQSPANSSANGINIDDRNPAHYANVSLPTSMALQPGFYRFSLKMSAHTDGDSRDGLARVLCEHGNGCNGLRVTVFKGAAFIDKTAV